MALIRLHPYNPRLGWVIQTYTDTQSGLKFLSERGWYQVDDKVAERLAEVPQQERFPTGPRAFLVAKDTEEANRLDARIKEALRLDEQEQEVGTAEKPLVARPGAATKTSRNTVAVSEEDAKAEDRKLRTRKKSGGSKSSK